MKKKIEKLKSGVPDRPPYNFNPTSTIQVQSELKNSIKNVHITYTLHSLIRYESATFNSSQNE